jgi:uncharacterized protein YlxP (DUF503 family)
VARAEFGLPGAKGLKDKRRLVKSLIDRIQHRFRIAAAEVDHHDRWRRAAVGFACVSTSARHAHSILGQIATYAEREGEMVLMTFEVDVR